MRKFIFYVMSFLGTLISLETYSQLNPTYQSVTLSNGLGSYRGVHFQTDGAMRWLLSVNPDPESGANGGANFDLFRYADNGSYLGRVFSVDRATGAFNFEGVRPKFNGNNIVSADGGFYDINISGNASKWGGYTFDGSDILENPVLYMTYDGTKFRVSNTANIKSTLAYTLQDITSLGASTTHALEANAVGQNIKLGGTSRLGGLYQGSSGNNVIHLGSWVDISKTLVVDPVSGDVGIGTATPKEKLSVNGKIRAQEIKVEVTGWPDYVFEENYRPKTLAEIAAFIKMNKHLPEVPSAKEVEQKGIELGEMNKILLKKIEEMTLLLIEQNNRIEQLEKKK